MKKKIFQNDGHLIKGFTLLEILLVIGILAVLAVVVIVALDPAKRFQDSRNSRRLTDTQNILTAVQQYVVDNGGDFPSGLDTTEKQIGTATDTCSNVSGGCNVSGENDCIDLGDSLVRYLKDIPYDPAGEADEARSHYSIVLDANNIITVRACDAEGDNYYIHISG